MSKTQPATNQQKNKTPQHASWHFRLAQGMENFADSFPRFYLIFATLVAMTGYLVLALIPVFAVMAFQAGVQLAQAPATPEAWPIVGVYGLVSGVLLLVGLRITRMDYPEIKGLPIDKVLVPELFNTIEETRKYYKYPKFTNVILTDQYEMRIREIPILGLPFWTHKTLILGLPFLQLLSPKHFRCQLALNMAKQTRHSGRSTSQLFRAHNIWLQYHEAFNNKHRLGDLPLRWFANLYTPILELVALPAIRMNELAADTASQEHINEQDLFETIKYHAINDVFMRSYYLPRIRKIALHNPHDQIEPISKLENLAQSILAKVDRQRWLGMCYEHTHSPEDLMPDLKQRMENLGHNRLREVPVIKATAAGLYLRGAKKDVFTIIDKLWRSTTLPQWVYEKKDRTQQIKTITKLSKKSHKARLSMKDIWQYAQLAHSLRGDSYLHTFKKLLKRNLKKPAGEEATFKQKEAGMGNIF
jgi:hypothetical protein